MLDNWNTQKVDGPADPQASAAPTTSSNSKVTTNSPTASSTQPLSATDPPTVGEIESGTSPPTGYAPDDPISTYFCGKDWNHAITECPQRCPSGESSECPDNWQCFAFTSCFGVGINSPPTTKPTWEPTQKPTPSKYFVLICLLQYRYVQCTNKLSMYAYHLEPTIGETSKPTTQQQYWAEQNKQTYGTSAPATGATPAPASATSIEPTQDQCRGLPCEFEGGK